MSGGKEVGMGSLWAGEGVKGVGASWAQKTQPQGPRGDQTPPGAHRARSQGLWGRWSWTSRPLRPPGLLGVSPFLPAPAPLQGALLHSYREEHS